MWDFLWSVNFTDMLVPTMSPLEGILRISIVYLFLFFLIRVVLKREAAQLAITDLLVIVLVADAVQNAMAGGYHSLTDGLILAATLVFWNWALDYAAMRWRRVRPIIRPAPLLLVRDGKPIEPNLRKELMTKEELLGHVRLQGLENLEDVKYAFMEEDGRISIIPKEGKNRGHGSPEEKLAA